MLERIAQYLLVLVAAVSLNFFLPRAMPGSPLQFLAGEDVAMLPAAERQALLARTGLDQPLPHQYVKYVASLARGDWE